MLTVIHIITYHNIILQYVAAGIVSGIASLSIGTVLGFSAILIPQLIDEGIIDSDKSTEASWIGSYSKI